MKLSKSQRFYLIKLTREAQRAITLTESPNDKKNQIMNLQEAIDFVDKYVEKNEFPRD